MDFESVKSWLTKWTERQAANCRWKGVLGLVLVPVALAVALAIVFGLLKVFTHDRNNNPGDTTTCLWITLAVLPCLFIANRFTPHRDLMEERMREGTSDSFSGNLLERRQAVLMFFLWILFTGPRLLDWSLHSFRQVCRVKEMDVHSDAAVLWLLLTRGRKVSFDDIKREFDWVNLETVLHELARIPGVVSLQNPPPGLSLTEDLRNEIRGAPHTSLTAG